MKKPWALSRWVKLGCLLFLFGDLLFQLCFSQPVFGSNDVAYYRDLPIRIHFICRIVEEPDVRSESQNLVVEAGEIFVPMESGTSKVVQKVDAKKTDAKFGKAQPVRGKVMVKADRYPDFFYGDELDVVCKLQTPPVFEGFSYASLLAEDNIYAMCIQSVVHRMKPADGLAAGGADAGKGGAGVQNAGGGNAGVSAASDLWRAIFAFKFLMIERLNRLFAQPQASMVQGILFGERHSIPEEILAEFSRAGLIHALTVTGYSFSIIIGLFGYFLKSAARRWRYAGIFLGILGLVAMTGFSAKVLRAAWMASLALIAQCVGRKGSGVHLLLVTATVMVFLSPRMILVDLSFQFSFLSVLGILILMPKFEAFEEKLAANPRYSWITKLPSFAREAFWVTISAELFTIPLLILQSGSFSLIAPIANVFVLPMVPLVMLLSFLALVSSFVAWPIAQLFSYFAYVLLSMMLVLVNFFVHLPFATIPL